MCWHPGRRTRTGRFSINWRVDAATFETEFDIYAIFEGDSSHEKDRTWNQYMDVFERRGTTVMLYAIPDHVYAGDTVTFTGTLTHGGQPLAGKRYGYKTRILETRMITLNPARPTEMVDSP